MKYYGYIQGTRKDNTITNNISLGWVCKFSDDRDKLKKELIKYLYSSHGEKFLIQEGFDICNGEQPHVGGWVQSYDLIRKSNLRDRDSMQICVWAILEDEIVT